nr:shikimate dehydrogenase [Desulfobulbaceae bacterium]
MAINGATHIYGIMGNPVTHSLSPAMHNAAFAELGLNCAYVPFPVQDVASAMYGFKALNIKGVSVTIPHKQAVIPYLDTIDPVAKNIGAVNTLQIIDNRISGFNTDWQGANRALQQVAELPGKSVLILGAGGSARAIGFGLLENRAQVTIASRTASSGQSLAKALNCPWLPLSEAGNVQADILINATSVGMRPNHDLSPIDKKVLVNFSIVMDIVYAPLQTKLLRDSKLVGCKTINGTEMLLYQGAHQFELWTGLAAPIEVMRKQLLNAIQSA